MEIETKLRIARLLLKSPCVLAILAGIGMGIFFVALGHGTSVSEGIKVGIPFAFILFIITLIGYNCFAKQNIFAKIYLWLYPILLCVSFPIGTVVGVFIIIGQLAFYESLKKENA